MSDFFQERPHRKHIVDIQLTPLIDVFVMIVIFLILGTVFAKTDINIPPGFFLPESKSKETADSAPQLLVGNDSVTFSVWKNPIPLDVFVNHEPVDPRVDALILRLKEYVSRLPVSIKQSGVLLNVTAARETSYKTVFDVIEIFRKAGFESMLFVATGIE